MKRILVICLALIVMTLSIQAQNDRSASPIFLQWNDLWRLENDQLTRLTNFESVGNVSISHDGTQLAFTAFADMSMKAVRQSGGYSGVLPNDLWIMDITTGDMRLISGQPQNAIFPPEDTRNMIGISHSPASWSPDGCCLAWGEEYHHPEDYELRQVVYNLASNEEHIITTMPAQYGVPSPIDMRWNKVGILIRDMRWLDGDEITTLHIYSPADVLLNSITIDSKKHLISYDWIDDQGETVIGLRFRDQQNWFRLNPITSEISEIPYPIEYYSPMNPYHSLGIIKTEEGWQATDPNTGQSFDFTSTRNFTLSPDGRSVIFQYDGWNFMVQSAGETSPQLLAQVDEAVYVFWGPSARRVRYHEFRDTVAMRDCANSDNFLLSIGGNGQVLPGDPNTLRALPGVNSSRTGVLPAGTIFEVIGGPTCVDNYTWWQVQFNDLIGWTAQGDGTTDWLKPLIIQ